MMNDSADIMMLNTLTSTHPGSGTELSYVDMPIQREGHTGFPKIEAATLKGCIRSHLTESKIPEDELNCIFGKSDSGDFAAAVSMSDARLLFFPVKSVKGIFGWVTCPFVLDRFFKDYQRVAGRKFPCEWNLNLSGIITETSKLSHPVDNKDLIMLEDYTYTVKKCDKFGALLDEIIEHLPENTVTKDMIREHAVILSDDDFSSFVKYSTEVNTRIKIEPSTGTVSGNALFTEEYLPPECVLYSLLFFTNSHLAQDDKTGGEIIKRNQVKEKFLKLFPGGTIQVGAHSTLGKGFVEVQIWKEERDGAKHS